MNRRHTMVVFAGALLGLAAATGVVQQANSDSVDDLPPKDDRDQAARVLTAYALNGPYAECMQERGYDISWEWSIHLAPGLKDNDELEAVADDLEQKMRGDGNEELYQTKEFGDESNICLRQSPDASDEELAEMLTTPPGLSEVEEVAHWDKVMNRAAELGWSHANPFGDLTPPGVTD